jgi:hypothetical protein
MKERLESDYCRMTTVECERIEEADSEEDCCELPVSLLANFLSLFFRCMKMSLVPVRIISGISVVMRCGDSKFSIWDYLYGHGRK